MTRSTPTAATISEPTLDEPCVRLETSGCRLVRPSRGLGPSQRGRYPTGPNLMASSYTTMRFSLTALIGVITAAAMLFAAYSAGFRKGEVAALQVPLQHNRDRELVQGQIRLLAADTREPVDRCMVDFILIGPDGGDGGFLPSYSDSRGVVKLPAYLSPGRYQIEIDPRRNGDDRFLPTSYHTHETYLLIRPDKTYSPFEYLVDVKPSGTAGNGG